MFQITCIYSKVNSNFIVQNLQLQHLSKIPFDLLSFDFETSMGRRFKDAICYYVLILSSYQKR